MDRQSHPKGLYLLFATEMAERFSYYGMRALFTLYMISALYSMENASEVYGTYTSLVYLTPLMGGYLADRYLGNRKSIITGACSMAMGQFLMFLSASVINPSIHTEGGAIDSTINNSAALWLMFLGLGFIILGNGLFKPNISSMVGELYETNDTRKDSAFTIFYMGINIGAFAAPVICGMFEGNWQDPRIFRWGFLIACIAMICSLVIFCIFKDRYLRTPDGTPIGMAPSHHTGINKTETESLTRQQVRNISIIFIVAVFVIFFWAAYEQAGVSLTYFADQQTERHIMGWQIPTSWFQCLPAIFCVMLAPVMAYVWEWLHKRGHEPSSYTKQAIGLLFLSIGYLVISFGVKDIDPNVKVSMLWITSLYFLHEIGELSLSPIGLSLVSKLSPKRFASLLMGVWFMSTAVSNYLAGQLSTLYPDDSSTPKSLFGYQITDLQDFFLIFVIMSGVASLLLFIISPLLRKMEGMRGENHGEFSVAT